MTGNHVLQPRFTIDQCTPLATPILIYTYMYVGGKYTLKTEDALKTEVCSKTSRT